MLLPFWCKFLLITVFQYVNCSIKFVFLEAPTFSAAQAILALLLSHLGVSLHGPLSTVCPTAPLFPAVLEE